MSNRRSFGRGKRKRQQALADFDARSEPRSQEEVDLWTRLCDPEQTSPQEFLEAHDLDGQPIFWITTKETHGNKTAQVPLKLWPNQLFLLRNIEEMWAEGRAAKLRIPKDREQGISFLIQVLFAWCFLVGGGGTMLTVSHKEEATKGLCEDFNTVLLQIPPWVYRIVLKADWASRRDGRWKLVFPRTLVARAKTLTCRDDAMGRGERPRWMHMSERPHWMKGKKGIRAALTVLRDAAGNIYVDESTGKDFDDFYEGCVASRDGDSDWRCLFFSALTHPLKLIPFTSAKAMEEFAEKVGREERFGAKDELLWQSECQRLGKTREETLERLHWRRRQIAGPCSYDLALFMSEHPILFEQCFRIDSSSAFDTAILDSRRRRAEMEWPSWRRGNLDVKRPGKDAAISFVPDRLGLWFVRHDPEPGHAYCYGADPASGKKTIDQGRYEADFATMAVWDITADRIAAFYRGHTPPERLQVDLLATSKWYGWMKGYPEANNDGKVLLSERYLPSLQDEWDVPDDICLRQTRLVIRDGQRLYEPTMGFYADPATKHLAVHRLARWIREIGPLDESDPDAPARIPMMMLAEARKYVVIYRKDIEEGKRASGYGAISGHDDLVTALYLCFEAKEYLEANPQERTYVAKTPVAALPGVSDVRRAYKEQNDRLEREHELKMAAQMAGTEEW